ncbi:MAG: hypothetical protein N2509_02180 [Treponemataceae bacterium]|nr:hypothetical protein [Treponemataceae bacterium]
MKRQGDFFFYMRKWTVGFLVIGITVGVASGCRQFFTTSLAPWAARDPATLIPPVTTANVGALAQQTADNPEMAAALLDKIAAAIPGASPGDKAVLQAAALDVAANASGVTTALYGTLSTIDINNLQNIDQNALLDTISAALAGLDNLQSVAATLADIIPYSGSGTSITLDSAFVAAASPEDLVAAAIVLVAAEAQASGNIQNYVSTFNPSSPSGNAAIAVALVDAAASSGGTGDLLNTFIDLFNLQ